MLAVFFSFLESFYFGFDANEIWCDNVDIYNMYSKNGNRSIFRDANVSVTVFLVPTKKKTLFFPTL